MVYVAELAGTRLLLVEPLPGDRLGLFRPLLGLY